MKLHTTVSAQLAHLQPNQIGLLAWSLLAQPPLPVQAGGVPGQPDPDSPQPPQPTEPGVPTQPDEPPPTPVA
ncbi:hypothetical protein [Pseudomonas shirazensis]|uniref:hypothetical protein n=1 Tax=Pseudomonas shirazensis TaxID=2745494 RepID=UPI003D26B280